MVNSNSFRVWNVYPLDSLPFWLIVGGCLGLLSAVIYLYNKPNKRRLMAAAILLAPFTLMLIWNLSVNLIPGVNWEVFTAYVLYILLAQFLMSAGLSFKQTTLRWGGWFYLYFTLIHFFFINIWLIDRSFQYSLIALFLAVIYFNRDLLPGKK